MTKKLLPLAILLILISCGTKKINRLFEYNIAHKESVLDSIIASGTEIGEWSYFIFVLDDGVKDTVNYSTLYRENKAVGSIQMRNEGNLTNIKIIDVW